MEKIEFLSAVLIVSKNPERLFDFYKNVIGLPLTTEDHGPLKTHYGCEMGDIHFAIHPFENFDNKTDTGAVRLAFTTFDIKALSKRIQEQGYELVFPVKDTGFALMTAVHDPDGNYIEFTELSPKWFQYLESRKTKGQDVVVKWKAFKTT